MVRVPMGNDRLFTAVLTTQSTEGDATVRTTLDARTLEGMRVEIEHSDCGGRFDAPTRVTDAGHVLIELLSEQQQAHGTGRYTMIVTGHIPAPEHHDGRRAITLTTPLCEVVEATDTTTIEPGAPIDLHIAPLLRGRDGAPGRDGKDGKDGKDGAPGKDGSTLSPETMRNLEQLEHHLSNGVLSSYYSQQIYDFDEFKRNLDERIQPLGEFLDNGYHRKVAEWADNPAAFLMDAVRRLEREDKDNLQYLLADTFKAAEPQ